MQNKLSIKIPRPLAVGRFILRVIMYELTISIVTYKNNIRELMRTVDSVLNSNLNLKLIISDNSPTDTLRSLFDDSRIEYLYNEKNFGFGAGHNIAIKKILNSSKYHLALNPDTYFNSDVLGKIVAFMDENTQFGLFMPKIFYSDGSTSKVRRILPTLWDVFGKNLFPFLPYTKRRIITYSTDFFSYNKQCSIPFVSGSFLFFRTSELIKIGLFDERFFMYFEDTDISRRFYKRSKTVYYPRISISHIAHQDSHHNLYLSIVHINSAIKYFNKWGWFFDKERKIINKETLLQLGYKK